MKPQGQIEQMLRCNCIEITKTNYI